MAHLDIYVYSLIPTQHTKHHLLRYIQSHFHVIRFGTWYCWWWWCCFSEKKMSTGVYIIYMRHYITSKPLETNHNVLFFGKASITAAVIIIIINNNASVNRLTSNFTAVNGIKRMNRTERTQMFDIFISA